MCVEITGINIVVAEHKIISEEPSSDPTFLINV